MNNAQINAKFLAATDAATKAAVLANIAKHYGITSDEAYAEVTEDEAEHLLDYMTGPQRAATSLLMKRHALARKQNEAARMSGCPRGMSSYGRERRDDDGLATD